MKTRCIKIALTAASLMLAANLVFAADVKISIPDLKGAAWTTGDNAKAGAKSASVDAKAAAKSKIVDINTATEAELKAFPGLGDAYAAKIIVGSPYAMKDQLKSLNILPASVYEKTIDLLHIQAGRQGSSQTGRCQEEINGSFYYIMKRASVWRVPFLFGSHHLELP